MHKIEWTQELSVGVEVLDDQHRNILLLINKLIKAPDDDPETISNAIDEMTHYAEMHLATEEAILQKYHYADLATHEAEHDQYRKQTVDFCFSAMSYKRSLLENILEFLQTWWIKHIKQTDMQYKAFLKEVGVK